MRPSENPISILCDLLKAGDQTVTKAAIGASAAVSLEALAAAGLAVSDGLLETLICDACDNRHFVDVVVGLNGKHGWQCPEVGFVVADIDQLQLFAVRLDILVARLRDVLVRMLGAPRRVARKLDGTETWVLGAWPIASGWTTIAVTRGLSLAAEGKRVADAIASLPPNDAGLLINIAEDSVGFPVPNGFATLPLVALLEISSEGIARADQVLLERTVKPLLAVGKGGRSGRSSSKVQVFTVVDALVNEGAGRPALKPQLVKRHWAQFFPKEAPPGTSTVRKHLATWMQDHPER